MTTDSNQRASPRKRARNILGVGAVGIAVAALFTLGAVGLFAFGYFFLADPPGKIRITEPEDGAIVHESTILIRGTSSPDWAGVFRIDGGRNEEVQVDEDGDWEYRATLEEGSNTLTFHLGSAYGQSDRVTLTFEPN